MPVYLLHSDQTPQPMTLAALPDPNAAAPAYPLTHTQYAQGATLPSSALNRDSRRNELTAILGAGAVAVGQGLDLSSGGGLTLSVSPGAHNNGGWVYQSAAQTLALPNNVYHAGDLTVRLHLWLSRTGDLSYRTDLTQPASPCTYLGSVRTSGGTIHDIDYSGRVELNAIPYRRTADPGAPNASLPANWRGLVRTGGGLYWWDGSSYIPSMDAQTVLVSLDHTTAGALEDVVTAGEGVALSVVDVGGGLWKLRIAFDAETSGLEDRLAAVDDGDNAPGQLAEKLTATADFAWTPTGPDPGDRRLQLSHTPRQEALPAFDVTVPRGEERYVKIDFSARGHFPTAAGTGPGYTVTASWTDPGGAYVKHASIEELLAFSDAAGSHVRKSGGVCLLRIRNFTPEIEPDQPVFRITLTLTGTNWTAGGTPSASPAVTVYDWQERHVEELAIEVDCPPGENRVVKVDFSLLGTFTDEFHVRAAVDVDLTRTLISRLVGYDDGLVREDGYQEGSQAFGVAYLVVQRAADGDDGDYGYGDYYSGAPLPMTLRLEGRRWRAGAGGDPVVTVTPFSEAEIVGGGDGGGALVPVSANDAAPGYLNGKLVGSRVVELVELNDGGNEALRLESKLPATLTDAATIATDASLATVFDVSIAADRTLGAPTNPRNGQRGIWRVKNTDGSAHTLTLASGSGGFRFGTTITALSAIGAGKLDQIGAIYHAGDNRWDVVAYAKGF